LLITAANLKERAI